MKKLSLLKYLLLNMRIPLGFVAVKKKMPPWIYGTSDGALRLDTKHPEWIKYFTEFITKNAGRIKTIHDK